MSAQTHTCDCGVESTFDGPDDGMQMFWECPACGAKNLIPGEDPAHVAVAQAVMTDPDVVAVTDGDAGLSGEAVG